MEKDLEKRIEKLEKKIDDILSMITLMFQKQQGIIR